MRSVKYLVAAEPVDHGSYLSRIPDAILPSQFFESVGAQTFSSEQRLMLAILADAINVLGSTDSSNLRRRSYNEAWSWVFAKRITSSLSFDHVCDALGVDAESLRRRLSELVSEHGDNDLVQGIRRYEAMGKSINPDTGRGICKRIA